MSARTFTYMHRIVFDEIRAYAYRKCTCAAVFEVLT